MSIKMDLWRVRDSRLEDVPGTTLDFENRLEDWLEADPTISGMRVAIIGRQVETDFAGRIDLLALDSVGNTVVLELKRGRTPRDVVAQVLDYGSWVRDLSFADLDRICEKHRDKDLASVYSEVFGTSLPDTINDDHQLVIVAPELDDSSERIVNYLAESRGLPINVVFFNMFQLEGHELVGRAWLKDPSAIEERTGSSRRPPWRGYWFVNVGEGDARNWDDCRKYGFLSAGGGNWYSEPLKKLSVGAQIFAYMKGLGYVGFGLVTAEAVMIRDFTVGENGTALLDMPLKAPHPDRDRDDPELCEWVIRVDWRKTFSRESAQWFTGAFANQNIACKLRHSETVDFLERNFGVASDDETNTTTD